MAYLWCASETMLYWEFTVIDINTLIEKEKKITKLIKIKKKRCAVWYNLIFIFCNLPKETCVGVVGT